MGGPRDGREAPLDAPRIEFDATLDLLKQRADEVIRAQERLQGLLRATRSVVSRLDLNETLRHIVEAACELVDAPYGALGVIAPSGSGLEAFVHSGLDEATVAAIGGLPEGKGLLGVLIEEPHAVRLANLGSHPRTVGFPEGHPPMKAFLGVPVPVRGEIFGNLYLTRPDEREFSEADEELVASLAATAGLAIENARLYDEARQRQQWLQASTVVTRGSLTDSDDSLVEIARQVADLADAEICTVVLVLAPGDRLRVEVAEGREASILRGMVYPLAGTVSGEVLRTAEPVSIADVTREGSGRIALSERVDIGPAMVLPLAGSKGARGTLVVGRSPGRRPFTGAETEMASTFATQAALALELAEARADQERLQLYEDRARIARDLHDHVIQQLYASGLTVQGISRRLGDPELVTRLEEVVVSLDDAIGQIRTSIFQLRQPERRGLRAIVTAIVADLRGGLGFEPFVRFVGPVDSLTDGPTCEDVAAIVRESLTNITRHASASTAELEVRAEHQQLVVTVRDDGSGMGRSSRRSGLDNLRVRAERRGGTIVLADGIGGRGLSVIWSVPLN
jgi:signal transduction histidine kinase